MSTLVQTAKVSAWIISGLVLYIVATLLGAWLTGDAVTAAAVGAVITTAAVTVWRHTLMGPYPSTSPAARGTTFWSLVAAGLLMCWLFGQTLSIKIRLSLGSEGFDKVLDAQSQTPVWVLLLTGAVLAPIGEEALMRGFAYPLLRRVSPPLVAAAITSAGFALLHGNLAQIALAFPLGMLLAYLYEATGRLRDVVICHIGYNLMSMLIPAGIIEIVSVWPMIVIAAAATLAAILIIRVERAKGTSRRRLTPIRD